MRRTFVSPSKLSPMLSDASFIDVASGAVITRSTVTETTFPSPPITSTLPKGLSIHTDPVGSIGNSRTTRVLAAKLAPKSCVAESSATAASEIRSIGLIGISSGLNAAQRLRRLDADVYIFVVLRRFPAERVDHVGIECHAAAGELGQGLDRLDADGRVGIVLQCLDERIARAVGHRRLQ